MSGQPEVNLPIAGADSGLDLRLAELRGVARDPQVTRHGELAAAAQRVAVHGRDDGLAAGFEAPQHRLAAQRSCLAVERTLFREVPDVRPRHERLLPGARQDRALDRVVGGHALGRVGQLVHHLVVQGVQLVGAVDGDEGDGVAEVEEEGFVGHDGNGITTMRNAECGVRNVRRESCGERPLPSIPHSEFRTPHSTYGTTTLPDPRFPSLVAVMSDDPDPTARITTVWPKAPSMRATKESLSVHATGRPDRMFPWASRSVAKNVAVSPAATTAVSGVTETVATESFGGGGGQGAQDDRLPERSLDARQGRIGDAPLHVGVPGGIPLGVTQVGKEVRAVAHDDAGGRR